MDVAFTIRRADALRALKEIKVNRGREGKDDLLHILVSEYAVTFRAVGTESEYPVNGTGPGAAQVPIAIFERALGMRTTNELQLRLTDGAIFSGKSVVRHPAVTIGAIPDISISVPINSLPFDLLVIERIIGTHTAIDQGLASRLQKAKEGLPVALAKAAAELTPYGVTAEDLKALVEKTMRQAEPKVRASLHP